MPPVSKLRNVGKVGTRDKVGNVGQVCEAPHITRPPNCFMLWSCEMRKNIAKTNPKINNTDISTLLGQMWMNMSNECKLQYRQKADNVKHVHKLLYPDYKYTPKSKTKTLEKITKKNCIKKYTRNTIKKIKSFKNIKNININITEPKIELKTESEPDYYSEIELFYEQITA